MSLKILLGKKGCAVDALQHWIALVTPPVGSGNSGDLKGFDLTGVDQVGAAAEVKPIILSVDRHHRLVHLFQHFDLVGLVALSEDSDCFLPIQFPAKDRRSLLDYLLHFSFDLGNILYTEGFRVIKIIVETVFDGWANSNFGFRIQALHRLGHDVRSSVAKNLQGLFVILVQRFDGAILFQWSAEINEFAVYLSGNRGVALFHSQTFQSFPCTYALRQALAFVTPN